MKTVTNYQLFELCTPQPSQKEFDSVAALESSAVKLERDLTLEEKNPRFIYVGFRIERFDLYPAAYHFCGRTCLVVGQTPKAA